MVAIVCYYYCCYYDCHTYVLPLDVNLLKRKLKREREMYDNIEQQVFTINPLALNRDEDHASTTM